MRAGGWSTTSTVVVIVAVGALALAVVQTTRVGGLEERVDALALDVVAASEAARRPPPESAPPPATPAVREAAVARVAPATEDAAAQQIAALQSRVETLEALARARAAGRLDGTAAEGDGAAVDEVEALREDVDALLTGEGFETEEGRAAVRRMLDQARADRREERARQQLAREQAWLDEAAARVVMTDDEKTQVGGLLQARRDARDEVRAQLERGELTWTEARDALRASRNQVAEDARRLLGDERFEQLEAELGPWRGGRGGRGPR